MEKVSGIGGIFFKAQDTAKLSAWYRKNLGVPIQMGNADFLWRDKDHPDQIGRTAWSLFPTNTKYFGQSSAPFMINYRVENLDRMISQLETNGVTVEKVQKYDYGRFAWITDPEGHRIELWEPKKAK